MQSNDSHQGSIDETLRNIRATAQHVIQGPALADPDALSDAITRQQRDLETNLASLMSDPEPTQPPTSVSLFGVVRSACEEVCREEESTTRVTYPCDGVRPIPPVDQRVLRTLVRRLCHLALDHAGADGELEVSTPASEDGCAVRFTTRCRLGKQMTVPPELHYRSVEAFAAECGGALSWLGAGREIELNLRLPSH